MLVFAIVGIIELIICWAEFIIVRKDEDKNVVRQEITLQLIITQIIGIGLYKFHEISIIRIILILLILLDIWRHVTLFDYCYRILAININSKRIDYNEKKIAKLKAGLDEIEVERKKYVMELIEKIKRKNIQLYKYDKLTALLDEYMLTEEYLKVHPEDKYKETDHGMREILLDISCELEAILENLPGE